jgi:hypothetical protein
VSAKSVETRLSLAISARKRRRDEGAVGLGAEAARDEGAVGLGAEAARDEGAVGLGAEAARDEGAVGLGAEAARDEGAVGLGAEAARDEGAAPRTAASAGQHLSWLGGQTAMAREEFAVPDTADPRVDAYIRTPA